MPDITGEKLITASYLFGTAGVIFATVPFLTVIVAGIVKGNGGGNHNKPFDIMTIVAWAFIVHFVSCFLFMGLILILDNAHLDIQNYYTTKVFPIFWAKTQADVYSIAGVQAGNDILSGVAYATLHFAQKVVVNLFLLLPIFVFVIAMIFGIVLSNKDNYDKNVTSYFAYTSIAFVLVSTLYLLWGYIASYSVFLPNGQTIIDMVMELWQEILSV